MSETHGQPIPRPRLAFVCREQGADCDYEIRDSNEDELLLAAADHLQRRHGRRAAPAQLRTAMRELRRGVGGL